MFSKVCQVQLLLLSVEFIVSDFIESERSMQLFIWRIATGPNGNLNTLADIVCHRRRLDRASASVDGRNYSTCI